VSAGEASFCKALFFGVVAEDLIFPFPRVQDAVIAEVHDCVTRVRRFVESEVDSSAIDGDARVDASTLGRMAELGLFGLSVPPELGGLGLSRMASCRVVSELAAGDPSLGLVAVAHEAIGLRAIRSFGSPELQQRLVLPLARGERLVAFALAEDISGTDASTTRTIAERSGDGWVLDGDKPWVTNGVHADVFVVLARTSRLDEGHKPRLTPFVVERGPGVTVGPLRPTLGLRGAGVAQVSFRGVRLPADAILGEVGRGFRVAMEVMTDARVALSAWLFGQLRSLVSWSVARVQDRRSFGRVIGEFPIVKNKVAKMLADAFAIESMTFLTAGLIDNGVEDTSLESSLTRIAASEALWRTANEAMQIAGGSGYGTALPLERRLRDARGGLVVDGTNETLRCFVALSGLRAPGERLAGVERAMVEPVKGFGLLRDFALRKVRGAIRRERMTRAHPLLGREAVMFEEGTDALQRAAERALRDHGREIAEVQQAQLRIANVVMDLYALAACIARTTLAIEERGESGARREIDLTSMFAAAARARMEENLARLEHADDALRKAIVSRTYTDGGYPFDVI
jgi:acyl-CoA dehydrogenase family protein 9